MSFRRPDIIRPPSERKSYFLPLTSGCSNNTCTFCGYYGSKLQIRKIDDIKDEIDALSLFMRSGLRLPTIPGVVYDIAQSWDGKRVFLQDGDALVYPFPKLTEVLQYLNKQLPSLERIAAYATPQDILRRDSDELKQLKQLKLGIVYVGVESDDDELRHRIGKHVSSHELVEVTRKTRDAGIAISVTVILGLGGVEGSEKHAFETAKILTKIDPDYAGALTLTLVPATPLFEQWKEGQFHPIAPFRSLEELKIIIDNSRFSDCFFSSMHASNYISVRGKLPQNKERMLEEVERTLAIRDPSLLRPEFLRGL